MARALLSATEGGENPRTGSVTPGDQGASLRYSVPPS